MSKVIASRSFYFQGHPEKTFVLEIDAPQKIGDNDFWQNEVRIVGAPEGYEKMNSGGNDSYQALTIAITLAQGMIATLNNEVLRGKLRFLDDESEDLGLRVSQV